MSLKLSLKPGEKMIIGGAVVKNGDAKMELFIENQVPLLREKDIMAEKDAKTVVGIVKPSAAMSMIDNEKLKEIADVVEEKPKNVFDAL